MAVFFRRVHEVVLIGFPVYC